VDSLAYLALAEIEKAQFSQVEKRIRQLAYIAEEFKNDHALGCYYEISAKYLLKRGKAQEAISLEQKVESFLEHFELGLFGIYIHGLKAKALLTLRRYEECELSLKEAEGLIRKTPLVPPHFKTRYSISRFALEVARLEDAMGESGNRGRVNHDRKAVNAGRAALACSKKWIGDRTEALRLMGTYFWLRGRRTKALHYWRESLDLGERIGARLELARTWMEVGRRLREKGNGTGSLGGVGAEEYLSQAEAFFRQKDLSWDLTNLESIRSN
jgi:tetratricopeptide (TPR) repeat protein